jgi:hypothetical protein
MKFVCTGRKKMYVFILYMNYNTEIEKLSIRKGCILYTLLSKGWNKLKLKYTWPTKYVPYRGGHIGFFRYSSFIMGFTGDTLIFPVHCIKLDCIDKLGKDVIWNNNHNASIYCQLVYIAGKEHSNEQQNLNLFFRWKYFSIFRIVLVLLTESGIPSYHVRQHKHYIWQYIREH